MSAAEFLVRLLQANLAAALAVALVLLARGWARRLLGPGLAYGLWLIPLAAMAAGLLPPRVVPEGARTGPTEAWLAVEAAITGPALPLTTPELQGYLPVASVLLAVWALGSAASLLASLVNHRTAIRAFGAMAKDGEGVLRARREGCGPAIVGLLRPRLVLPCDFEHRFSPLERDMILIHEGTHLAFGHIWINALSVLIAALNWFNPMVRLGAYYARVDQELACDAAVVERHPGERRTYAEAMLKSQLVRTPLPLGCTWPARSTPLLKERIAMLAIDKPTRNRRLAGAAAIALLAAAAAAGAWAMQPAQDLYAACQGVRLQSVTLPNGLAPGFRLHAVNEGLLASSIEKGELRTIVDGGGAAADVAEGMRRKYQQAGLPVPMLPQKGTERFALFSDGEFGIAGMSPRGGAIIVNDGGFDEVDHPEGIATARPLGPIEGPNTADLASCPAVPAVARPERIGRTQAAN